MRRRLMGLVAAILVPVAATAALLEYRLHGERLDDVRERVLETALAINRDLLTVVSGTRDFLTAASIMAEIREGRGADCDRTLAALQARAENLVSIVVTDASGIIACASTPPLSPYVMLDRPYMARARQAEGFVVGGFVRTRTLSQSVLPFVLPLRDAAGQGTGLLIANMSIDWLAAHLRDFVLPPDAVITVADADGVTLARSRDHTTFAGQPFQPGALPFVTAAAPGTAEVIGLDAVPRLIGYVPATLPPVGLYVGVGRDRDAAFRPARLRTALESGLIAGSFLLALAAAWFGAGHVDRLQRRMTARAAELQAEREQRLKAEATAARAQKLEAVGQLTAGLAHDFNNLLTTAAGNIELAALQVPSPKVQTLLDRAMAALQKGSTLTAQLLAFARDQKLELGPVPVNETVESLRALLERSAGPAMSLRLRLDPAVDGVLADRAQLEVALINLVVNARDAMALGGSVQIATRLIADPALVPPELPAGAYVAIEVADAGPGMAPEVLARAFEPFFTTKAVGEGSGLGLAQVYGIARQCGGTARIDSAPGRGTTVTIVLPRAALPTPVQATAPAAAQRTRALRVALVDDDPEVRATLAQMLTFMGHTVEVYEDGAALLARLPDAGFDLLVSDYAMPAMTGSELARRAVAALPGLKVLLVTGFTMGLDGREIGWPLLRKPFRTGELADMIARLVERPGLRVVS